MSPYERCQFLVCWQRIDNGPVFGNTCCGCHTDKLAVYPRLHIQRRYFEDSVSEVPNKGGQMAEEPGGGFSAGRNRFAERRGRNHQKFGTLEGHDAGRAPATVDCGNFPEELAGRQISHHHFAPFDSQ